MDCLLSLEDVQYRYPSGTEAVRGVSLCLQRGSSATLLGHNGSGKTTLLLLSAGLLKPSRGRVRVAGIDVASEPRRARRHIGLVFQNPDDQLFNTTVYDELAFAPRSLGIEGEELDGLVRRYAGLLGIEHLLERPVHTLSMGEKKRVALASVLIYEPELLLLDEPFAGLDAPGTLRLLEILCRLCASGFTVLVATQNLWLAEALGGAVYVMEKGKIVLSGEAGSKALGDRLRELGFYKPETLVRIAGCRR